MKLETWRHPTAGKRVFSPPVSIFVGLTAAVLVDTVFDIGEGLGALIVFAVWVWMGNHRIAEGEQGDRLTRAALYASLAVLAGVFVYHRL